ncbi:glycoside hydrolase family 13 protein [Halalkalibacter hemicellulosilyticus]|uniref:Neopullulanase n=1 Tax=Halalkalibacter hemicellulosilyticusJCM 9152 TaxID=1236971 RepID=W4QJ04_9BACI|nr:glycoside hydrolase family 13 protein [Halalkalibacter hemicellulosilyticus]GAE32100.1 neopullulanase [Halalkalibacter hemicellulosilyticusJCM 9152]
MLKEAIYHRPKNEFAYAIDERTIHIRIRTKKKDVQQAILIHGDPYDYNAKEECWIKKEKEMTHNGNDDLYDYWLVSIEPEHRRLRYGFKLVNSQDALVYTEKGFYREEPLDASYYFCFPFLNQIDVFSAPNWVKNTVWYQIFPERFANGDTSINPPETLDWGSEEPSTTNFFGGDFQGVIDHLDYLHELGITGIYFTPIFKAYSNHKYDTIDYLEIDPQFGDKHTFKRLINECHQRGIRVMLDAVFNHSGFYFPPFQDVLEKGEASRYKDWFHIHEFPVQADEPANYDTFAYVPTMPKLNTENKDVKDYLLKVARYWIEEFDIDGWRLDVANEVDHAFWRDFRKEVRAIKPELFILGEIWHDSMPWLQGDQFDAVMNYRFTSSIIDYFAHQTIDANQLMHSIHAVRNSYPETVNDVQFNLLGSHDTPRILTVSDERTSLVKLQMTLLFSMAGTPCIYYGDEIAMTGDQDPGCRKCMQWEEQNQDQDMLTFMKTLISLRKEHKAFRSNEGLRFYTDAAKLDVIVYEKQDLLFILNRQERAITIPLPPHYNGQSAIDLWTNDPVSFEETVTIDKWGYAIYQLTT